MFGAALQKPVGSAFGKKDATTSLFFNRPTMNLTEWMHTPTASERVAKARADTAGERRKLEREIRDLEHDAANARTKGDNEVHAGRDTASDAHYARVFQLETQAERLRRTADTLRAAESRMQDAEAANTTSRAFSSAARALETANRRMPGAQVQADSIRIQLANEQMESKMEIMNDAMNYDDDQEESAAVSAEKARIASLKEAAMRKRMPATGPLPASAAAAAASATAAAAPPPMASTYAPSTSSPLSSTAAAPTPTAESMGLPPVRPLGK